MLCLVDTTLCRIHEHRMGFLVKLRVAVIFIIILDRNLCLSVSRDVR